METNPSDQDHLCYNIYIYIYIYIYTYSVLKKLLKGEGINCCKTGSDCTKLADNHKNVYKKVVSIKMFTFYCVFYNFSQAGLYCNASRYLLKQTATLWWAKTVRGLFTNHLKIKIILHYELFTLSQRKFSALQLKWKWNFFILRIIRNKQVISLLQILICIAISCSIHSHFWDLLAYTMAEVAQSV
jgi:hypothetical protein